MTKKYGYYKSISAALSIVAALYFNGCAKAPPERLYLYPTAIQFNGYHHINDEMSTRTRRYA